MLSQSLCRARVNRKQFLMADSKTIYAFAPWGEKFPTCKNFTDKTCDIKCKPVEGLSSVSLDQSLKGSVTVESRRVYTGNDCEWIDLNKVVLYIFQISDDNANDQTF